MEKTYLCTLQNAAAYQRNEYAHRYERQRSLQIPEVFCGHALLREIFCWSPRPSRHHYYGRCYARELYERRNVNKDQSRLSIIDTSCVRLCTPTFKLQPMLPRPEPYQRPTYHRHTTHIQNDNGSDPSPFLAPFYTLGDLPLHFLPS
jgi:hypothetical protein